MGEPEHEVAIIDAGPGGIAAVKLLQDKGITGSRRFTRRSPLTDYGFQYQPTRRPWAAPHAKELSA